MPSEFRLFWVRGSEKGQSDMMTPDENHKINFNGTFEARCTIYISKTDGHARPKKLKLVLKRYVDSQTAKIYGRLTIDVGRYFGVKGFKRESIEMESGRSTAPVMNASFMLKQIGDSTISDIDMNEKSYFEEDDARQPLADWDQTEQKDGEDKAKMLTPAEVLEQEEMRAEQVGKRKRKRKSSTTVREDVDMEEGEEKKRKRRKISRQKKEELDDVSDEEPKKEEEEKEDEAEARKVDIAQLLKNVLTRQWDSMYKDVLIDSRKKVPFPPAVFPILAALLHTKIFDEEEVTEDQFQSAMSVFFEEYEKAPLEKRASNESKFLTSLVLCLVLDMWSNREDLLRERVMEFLRKMSTLLSQIATKIVSPFLMNFQVLCNRFATAKFEVDPLLDDFKQVLEGVWANLKYPDSINKLMKEQFMALLDATLLNKLIANPARFMFSNAIVWNSFITAFETVEKHPLDSLRQSVCAMVMAKNLTTPESSQEIIVTLCPDLDKKLLVYFMKNYRPDEMMPDPIDYERFREMMEVDDVISYGTVKPREVTSFSSAGEKLNYMEWNNVVITAPVSRAFPYFIAYVKGNE